MTITSVPFSGRDGRGGHVDRIMLHRLHGEKLVDVERWTGRDELCYPLERRSGSLRFFAGQPQIAGTVVWTTARSARGDRGSTRRSALQRASVTNTDAVHHHVPAGLDWKAISAAPATDEKTASAEPETPAYLGPWQPDD